MGISTNIEVVKQYFINKNYIPLFNEYKNSNQRLDFICPKHGKQQITYRTIKRGCGCIKCGFESRAIKKSYTDKEVRKVFIEKNFTPLFEKYNYIKQKLEYVCNKHPEIGIQKVTFDHLKNNKYLCKACRKEAISGKNAWNWNPNLDQKERKHRRNKDGLSKWRNSVFKRDNYVCQKCKNKSPKGNPVILNAHHIYNYISHINLRIDISNGIILCNKCHSKFHVLYGYKDNNKQQLNEFLGAGRE